MQSTVLDNPDIFEQVWSHLVRRSDYTADCNSLKATNRSSCQRSGSCITFQRVEVANIEDAVAALGRFPRFGRRRTLKIVGVHTAELDAPTGLFRYPSTGFLGALSAGALADLRALGVRVGPSESVRHGLLDSVASVAPNLTSLKLTGVTFACDHGLFGHLAPLASLTSLSLGSSVFLSTTSVPSLSSLTQLERLSLHVPFRSDPLSSSSSDDDPMPGSLSGGGPGGGYPPT